jgi:hypothetical protein
MMESPTMRFGGFRIEVIGPAANTAVRGSTIGLILITISLSDTLRVFSCCRVVRALDEIFTHSAEKASIPIAL